MMQKYNIWGIIALLLSILALFCILSIYLLPLGILFTILSLLLISVAKKSKVVTIAKIILIIIAMIWFWLLLL